MSLYATLPRPLEAHILIDGQYDFRHLGNSE
jgi:hypothetical protein